MIRFSAAVTFAELRVALGSGVADEVASGVAVASGTGSPVCTPGVVRSKRFGSVEPHAATTRHSAAIALHDFMPDRLYVGQTRPGHDLGSGRPSASGGIDRPISPVTAISVST